jgi:ATP-dependent helicase Lhr and Lhr-like helicase
VLASSMGIATGEADAALIELESEGIVLRGSFEHRHGATEWCDRRLLARIHRYTINRLRAEIEPVGAADFQRFLFAWQHVAPHARLRGFEGLQKVVRQLDGCEVAAAAWEKAVLPARVENYEPSMLDMLCLTGEASWARLSAPTSATVVSATPIALYLRANSATWQSPHEPIELSPRAIALLQKLKDRGACFARDLDDDLLHLGELVSAGLVTSDGFAGLRTLVAIAGDRPPRASFSGRWSALPEPIERDESAIETQARALLARYGIVFRRLLLRESNAAPWRELARIFRRLEARGEIRGGRFVHGMSGEQFALPDAVERMREIRRERPNGSLITSSGCARSAGSAPTAR